jgi:soluble lytic murein transglycosylase
MKEFNDNIDLVIAAYNGGSGNVKEWLSNRNYSKSGYSLDKIPFSETERFVKRVKNYYYVYTKLYNKN